MLYQATIEENSIHKSDIGERLIQAELVSRMKTVDTTKTSFYYPLSYRDRRSKPIIMKADETLANMTTAINEAYLTTSITLPVHPDDDTSVATVDHVFAAKSVVWGLPLPSDPTNKSIVYVIEGGFRVVKLTVDLTLAEIIALV
jgi:hypothetical protein